MDNIESAREWQKFANSDLGIAEHLSSTMWPVPIEGICYHCQQAAEKYLKAYLVLKGQTPPRTHDLNELLGRCSGIGDSFEQIADDCSQLIPYITMTRYPSDIELEISDVELALKSARHIGDFVQGLAPELLPKLDSD